MTSLYTEADLSSADWFASSEQIRSAASHIIQHEERSNLGQYFTSTQIARFMAELLIHSSEPVHLLDAGAGAGTLFMAAIHELCGRTEKPTSIRVTAFEVDTKLTAYTRQAMQWCEKRCSQMSIPFEGVVVEEDFIERAVTELQGDLFGSTSFAPFTIALLNPPYRKIQTTSRERQLLHRIGIEETNLYTAFIALALKLLKRDGELVAITPRSFCNGTYFTGFRRQLIETVSIQRLHLFDTRDTAFSEDNVLQEMLILHAIKTQSTEARRSVAVSSGVDATDAGMLIQQVAYERIIKPQDVRATIHIPSDALGLSAMSLIDRLPCSLSDLKLQVSTGKVVEFRAANVLRSKSDADCVPLIASRHIVEGKIVWPRSRSGKSEALHVNSESAALLIPADTYTVVKRMTSKDEKKRVIAAVYEQEGAVSLVAFENHINYYHQNGLGLDHDLAFGLAAFLNSTIVDTYFRQFNGHTQINAGDLRALRYPDARQLCRAGRAMQNQRHTQEAMDTIIQEVLDNMTDESDNNLVLARRRIDEAIDVLRQLKVPRAQQNERSALTLLALLNLPPDRPWSMASSPLLGVTQMMEFYSRHYGKAYAPNTRETVRRQTLHQFLDAALVRINPDNPKRPINSGQTVYQVEEHTLELLRSFGGPDWMAALQERESIAEELVKRYAQERFMARIPLKLSDGLSITLSPGGQNVLIEHIVHEFAERFIPGGRLIYIGDAENKLSYYDTEALANLGVTLDIHGKAPDVIIYDEDHGWLGLIEAVTSHGPINLKRKTELERLMSDCTAPLVFITAFLNRKALMKFMSEIAWETEVWIAEEPSHLIHFDGAKRIEPYQPTHD